MHPSRTAAIVDLVAGDADAQRLVFLIQFEFEVSEIRL
jgi:hypothetical protein